LGIGVGAKAFGAACLAGNRLRDQGHQVQLTSELPADLASAILEDLDNLRAPSGATEDGDTIIG